MAQENISKPVLAASQSTNLQSTFWHSASELVEFRYLVLESILHPIEAFNAYFPSAAFNMVKFSTSDIPDLKDKVFLVTGGNTGLGYEAIRNLAAHEPAHIYMACRTESKATAAIADIHKFHPTAKISYLPLDLTSFASIKAAAEKFQSESKRLDVLMLNAGIMAVPVSYTKEGFEIQLGTNHFGHFLLTKLLLPTLQATTKLPGADVRIVSLTSEAYNFARTRSPLFSQSELEQHGSAWTRYGYSKLANILFAKELAKRYPDILSVSIHPGLVNTDLYQTTQRNNIFLKIGLLIGGWIRVTPEEGALGQQWASVAPREKIVNGSYYKPVGVKGPDSGMIGDAKLAEEFWDWTEKQVESKGY